MPQQILTEHGEQATNQLQPLLVSPGKTQGGRKSFTLDTRLPEVLKEKEVGETLLGTMLKVITCGLGAGILATPWGAAGASLITSAVITGFVLVVNGWTVMIIVHAIDRWGGTKSWSETSGQWIGKRRQRGYRIDDLGQLLRQAPAPLPDVAVLWDITVWVSNFGVLVGYIIVVADTIPPLVASGCSDLARRSPWVFLGTLISLPLCVADLAFLTYSSAVGVAANIFLFGVVLYVFIEQGPAPDVCTLGVSKGSLTCMSNIVFSVVVQMVIPEYYTQLRRDDQDPDKFLRGVVVPSFVFIFVLIVAFSSLGYLAYGPGVASNVLILFPKDSWGAGSLVAISIACLMVYPNMLRPMVQPLLRGVEWCRSWRRDVATTEPAATEDPAQSSVLDIYEGRLVHTELRGSVSVDPKTGVVTLDVHDTRGFEKDALVFLDGASREYAVVKDVIAAPAARFATSDSQHRAGQIRLRQRYELEHAGALQSPALSALRNLELVSGTKLVLDEDPVLVTAAIVGERSLHVSFSNGLGVGARVVVGEGARAERHRIQRLEVTELERTTSHANVRTHEFKLILDSDLQHNHGAHTRVSLDHGPIEMAATAIVATVFVVALFIDDLGLVNVINGAVSVALIVGVVPALCAWKLHSCHDDDELPAQTAAAMPLSYRFRWASCSLGVICVVAGIAFSFFTDNHAQELVGQCTWHAA